MNKNIYRKYLLSIIVTIFLLGSFLYIGRNETHRNINYSKWRNPFVRFKKAHGIFIITLGRSGSSFFGELFKSHPAVLYHYEPLRPVLRNNNNATTEEIAKYIDELLSCNVNVNRSLYINDPAMRANRLFSTMLNCSEGAACKDYHVNITLLNEQCKEKYKYAAVKILQRRFPHGAKNILKNTKYRNKRIIQLVRDPRGVFNSMNRVGWLQGNGQRVNFDKVRSVCDTLYKDYQDIKDMKGYILLRYEDLCENLVSKMKDIFDFIGIKFTNSYKDYLLSILNQPDSETKDRLSPYSTSKNITEAFQKWRDRVDIKLVQGVEAACGKVMDTFGYIKVGDNTSLLHNRVLHKRLYKVKSW